jgi:S-(hydroxymethyl)glutathione dehydrogenase/alcohol dehydrogenase
MGIGGIGINAVQGARIAGARNIIAIDPVQFKRDKAMEFGATHTAATIMEAGMLVAELTRNQMADSFIITTDIAEAGYIGPALDMVAKRGKVVVTAVGHPDDNQMSGSLFLLTMMEKQIRGSLYGSSNAQHDIPRMLDLYNKGQLKLDELITREYVLENINQGYEDMRNGLNIRGLIRY